jgi:transcriptional regulator with XRE-family HTH domain
MDMKIENETGNMGLSAPASCSALPSLSGLDAAFRAGLRVARERAKMSQADLAKKTGLQPSAIAHFEAGRRSPSIGNLRKLCVAMRVSSDWLMCLPNEPSDRIAGKESKRSE